MKRLILILIPALVLTGGIAWASMAERMDLGQLTTEADRVVLATLERQASAWGPDHRRIYTTYRFKVTQDVIGEGRPELTIVQPGGTVGRWTQVTAGFPRFQDSQTVLLFLRRTGRTHQVVGLCQGVFELAQDAGRHLLVQRLEGLSFRADPGRPIILEREAGLARIRALAASSRGEP